MTCALERRLPSALYLLFDDQPPKITPYTARLVTANTNRMPMSRFAAIANGNPPGCDAGGTTEKASIVVKTEIVGAMTNRALSAVAGITSSLRTNLMPSATDCNKPNGP